MTVRVRVAPSPTGDPHVGTAYQALFNLAFARSQGGQFLLRIEDTDRTRSTPESERAILAALRWLGLDWDEGPDKGGPHGPYRQSERLEIYRRYASQLLEAGHAYRCFATNAELDAMRREQMQKGLPLGYDRRFRELGRVESDRRAETGEPFVLRMKVPTEGQCDFEDILRGRISKDWASIDDQVLMKSDGYPTYHLAVVVDDHLMGITHVIRGEEWLNSVPKHLALYDFFGWQRPQHCHLPLLRNADKSKLSKRKNPTSIDYFRRGGFVPEALLNFLALAGWRPKGTDEEKFSVASMFENFRIEDVSLGGPVFDVEKLRWLNGRYLREDYSAERYRRALEDWAFNSNYLDRIVPHAQPRTETLADFAALTSFFFSDSVSYGLDSLQLEGKTAEELAELFQLTLWELDKIRDWRSTAIQAVFDGLAAETGLKMRELGKPFYVAISGRTSATPLFDSMEILGSNLSRIRLRRAIEALGGLSKKRLKALEDRVAKRTADGVEP